LNQYGSFEAAGAMGQIEEIATALSAFSGINISPEMVVKNWELFSNIFASGEDGIKRWGQMMQELNNIEDFPWEEFSEVDWSNAEAVQEFTASLGEEADSVGHVFDYLAESATGAANALNTIEGANTVFQDRAEIAQTLMSSGEVNEDQYYEIIKAISETQGIDSLEASKIASDMFSYTSSGTYALNNPADIEKVADIMWSSGLKGYETAADNFNENIKFPETLQTGSIDINTNNGATLNGQLLDNESSDTVVTIEGVVTNESLEGQEDVFDYMSTIDPSRISAAGSSFGLNLTSD
jgi:hypothetical protein